MHSLITILAQDDKSPWFDLLVPLVFVVIYALAGLGRMLAGKKKETLADNDEEQSQREEDTGLRHTALDEAREPQGGGTLVSRAKRRHLPYAAYGDQETKPPHPRPASSLQQQPRRPQPRPQQRPQPRPVSRQPQPQPRPVERTSYRQPQVQQGLEPRITSPKDYIERQDASRTSRERKKAEIENQRQYRLQQAAKLKALRARQEGKTQILEETEELTAPSAAQQFSPQLLQGTDSLRQAIIYSEILGKPAALREGYKVV